MSRGEDFHRANNILNTGGHCLVPSAWPAAQRLYGTGSIRSALVTLMHNTQVTILYLNMPRSQPGRSVARDWLEGTGELDGDWSGWITWWRDTAMLYIYPGCSAVVCGRVGMQGEIW